MRAVLDSLKEELRQDPSCLQTKPGDDAKAVKGRKSMAMNICNLTLQIRLYSSLFDDECNICFKRNWILPGQQGDAHGIPFRSTWSAGWYLEHLKKHGITWT